MATTATLLVGTTIEEHTPAELTVDERVQRTLSDGRVGQMVAALDLAAIGVPILNRRANGTLVIIDGQHRIAALLRSGMGEYPVRCEVFEGLSIEDEAREFLLRNDRYLVDILTRFRISVQGGIHEAVKIDNIAEHNGFRVAPGDNAVLCVGALQRLYRGGANRAGEHPGVVDSTLRVISQAWGTKGTAIREAVLGVGLVFAKYGDELDETRLVGKLARLSGGPAGLAGRARTLRQIGKASTIAEAAAETVVDLYNVGLRGNAQLSD